MPVLRPMYRLRRHARDLVRQREAQRHSVERMTQYRFLYLDGQYQWRHLGEVLYLNPAADFTDCTDMGDEEFAAFVGNNPPHGQCSLEHDGPESAMRSPEKNK